jgi:Tfp pilus assembly protein PilE
MNKKGVTMIILIITIILIIVLLGITTASVGNGIQNSRYAAFGEDLALIQDEVITYYVQNGEYPILENVKYTYETNMLKGDDGTTIALNNKKQEYLEKFKQELIKNSDLSEGESVVSDTYFYKIDLSKIDIQKTTRGTLNNGENDVYVMAYPSQTLYYVKGVVANNVIYFSLADISDVKKSNVEDETTTFEQNGLYVTKEIKAWTNKLGIKINATLASDEKVTIKVPVRNDEIVLSTTTGENNITLESLKGSLKLTDNEVNRFNVMELEDKYIYVIKRKNGEETAKIKVDISNYETQSPTFPLKDDNRTLDFTITSEEGYNKITYQGNDNASGIGQVRYVYYKQFGANGIAKDLISDTSIINDEYMLNYGKKANVSNTGEVEINVPKDIEGIYITMFDKAGNSVTLQKNIETDIYVGINPVSISNNLSFNILVKSNTKITSGVAYFSEDGKNYIDEKNLTFTTDSNNMYNATVEFNKTEQQEVYVKVVVFDNSSPKKQETRVKKIDLKEVAASFVSIAEPGLIYEEDRYYTDKNGDKALIPAGYKVSSKSSEQTISDGLIVIDKEDNEYVWVPSTQSLRKK